LNEPEVGDGYVQGAQADDCPIESEMSGDTSRSQQFPNSEMVDQSLSPNLVYDQ